MIRKKKRMTLKYIIVFLLIIPISTHYLIFIVYADTNYYLALEKGTQVLEVKKYNDQIWQNTVSITSTPSDWLGGDADKIGAKSKITILWLAGNDMYAYSLFRNLIFPQIFSNITSYGYNYSYIYDNYPDHYFVWEYSFHYWAFTTKEFNDNPDNFDENLYILEEPQNYSKLLNDYNDFAGKINNDTTLQLLGYSIPIYNGDDLFWRFIIGRFALAKPVKEYLTIFTDTIDCENVSIQENSLVFQRSGEKNYSVGVTYSDQGLIDRFVVKDSEGNIFYEITSSYPKIIFYIILGIIAISVLGIATLVTLKKIKLNKTFR